MTETREELPWVDVPRPPAARPRLDARTTGWLLAQRERIRALELEAASLRGELDLSARVERGVQRFCDRIEGELERSRKREATLARALGYAEAQRDQLARQLAAPAPVERLAAPASTGPSMRSPKRPSKRG